MNLFDALVNYGALGIMLAGFLLGMVVAKGTHERVIQERDRAEQQRDKVLDDVMTQVAPALERAAEAIRTRTAYEETVTAALSDIENVMEDVRRLLEGHHL